MNNAVLISIQPKWVSEIINGHKTVEIRKTKPKQQTPFKCYIYCTKACKLRLVGGLGYYDDDLAIIHTPYGVEIRNPYGSLGKDDKILNGKVVGEFICDKIDEYTFSNYEAEYRITDIELESTCLNQPDLIKYGKGETLYGWHISDLKIYVKPKELSEFAIKKKCNSCKISGYDSTACPYDNDCMVDYSLKRAPQSWCYVEVKE